MSGHHDGIPDPISAMLRLSKPQDEPEVRIKEQARDAARLAWLSSNQKRRRRRVTYGLAAVAALLIVGLGLSVLIQKATSPGAPLADLEQIVGDIEVDSLTWNDAGNKTIALGAGSVLETAEKGRASFRLNNGSRVRLDSATRVRLAGERSLELEAGAIYFDSALGGAPDDPASRASDLEILRQEVEVKTELATLVNRGTSYEVRVSTTELVVAVRSGSVEVRRRGGGDIVLVERAQILRLSGDGATSLEALLPTDPRFVWTQPLIVPFDIDGKTVGEFLDWFEREGGIEVRLGAGVDPDLLEDRLSGHFVWVSPANALSPTLEMVGSEARFDDGLMIIERK